MEYSEMTLWDVIGICLKWVGKVMLACWHFFAEMIRLAYRKWYIVGCLTLIGIAVGIYYSRPSNKKYKVNAIATLNGPSVKDVADYYESLEWNFQAFNVIDCLHDGEPDFVDYKHKNNHLDTINKCMTDQIALQFIIRDTFGIPQKEAYILDKLNNNEAFVHSYNIFKTHLDRLYEFDKTQVEKIDSMTTLFYSSSSAQHLQSNAWELMMGRQEIILPNKSIDQFFTSKANRDRRYAMTTAPVVLHNHFIPQKRAENGRLKCTVLGLLIGWLLGSLLAWIVEQRKSISSWLKAGA